VNNESRHGTAFTVSIEAREGVTTGVSAADRVTTIRAAIADNAKPADIVRPGHVFPLRATPGGVLARRGHTEGTVDLAILAGPEAGRRAVRIDECGWHDDARRADRCIC
jgi:3,4-dihydroxy 2-butanone 4-phosphate synthase